MEADNQKEHDASVKDLQKEFLEEQKLLREAHEAKEAARKLIEQKQIAEHKKMMAERREKFEQRFKFVWSAGPTGCSIFYVTTETKAAGEKLISNLLSHTLTADVD